MAPPHQADPASWLALILYAALAGLEIAYLTRAARKGDIPSVGGANVRRAEQPPVFWFLIAIHVTILALFGGLTIWLIAKMLGF